MISLHPALPFLMAAVLIPLMGKKTRQAMQLLVPLISFWILATLTSQGSQAESQISVLGYSFHLLRMDSLSLFFVYALLLFSFFANLYALHVESKRTHVAANLYAGSSIAAVLAGDLVTLFIFWEMMALTSSVLILNKARPASSGAFLRYLLVHLTGGLFFFAGIVMKAAEPLGLSFTAIPMDASGTLIFIGFCINAAAVPFHAWLPDAYPEGTPAGSVYMSAFTTKVALYALARGFAGSEYLIWLGALGAIYGVIYALMENDMRRLLSYHIVCQMGYMFCGIGIGSEIGVNAGTAHAVGNIFFKGLLFMATGVLIHQTGKYKLSELGGLARENRLTLIFFMIGALAIAGLPFLNGYVSKSLLLKAAAKAHMEWLEIVLLLAAVGTFMSIALKLAYFAFWGDGHSKAKIDAKTPWNMNLAMGGLSILCLGIGVFPEGLYRLLPYPEHYKIFTADHILYTFQILAGTLVGFLLIRGKLHAEPLRALDVDWFYRKGATFFVAGICRPFFVTQSWVQQSLTEFVTRLGAFSSRAFPNQELSPVARPLFLIMAACLGVGIVIMIMRHL